MKYLLAVLLITFLTQTLALRLICPHPEEAGEEIAAERYILETPIAGHAAIEIDLSARVLGRELACLSLITESFNGGPHIVSLGKNIRGGFSVKIYTEEKKPLIAWLSAYTPRARSQSSSFPLLG